MLIGGNARRLVRIAAAHADVLELTGLGPTLSDGHAHLPLWSAAAVGARVELARHVVRDEPLRLGALVQRVEITSDRTGATEAYRELLAATVPDEVLPTVDELLDTPFLLIGTEDEIVSQLRSNQSRWGLTPYTTRAGDIESVARIIDDSSDEDCLEFDRELRRRFDPSKPGAARGQARAIVTGV